MKRGETEVGREGKGGRKGGEREVGREGKGREEGRSSGGLLLCVIRGMNYRESQLREGRWII